MNAVAPHGKIKWMNEITQLKTTSCITTINNQESSPQHFNITLQLTKRSLYLNSHQER